MRKVTSILSRITLGLIAAAMLPVCALAQSTATINGTVTDQSGAVIQNATITVTNIQTSLSRTATSDAGGHYVITNLSPGNYNLQAVMTGFSTVQRKNQEIFVGQTTTVDFPMIVSATQMVVEVQGQSTEVERTQADVTSILDTKQLDDLPVLSRNFSELAALAPGVQATSQVSVGFSVGGAVTGVTVGNSTQYATGYSVDNIPIDKPSDGGLYVAIAQDWVQEFSITVNHPPAEYPHAVSGYMNVVTRSGGNNIHGRAYSFFQNSAMNASNINPLPGARQSAKAPTSSERVGGMIGGPIFKDKLFYFAGYEYYRSLSGIVFPGLPALFAGTRGVLDGDTTPQSISNLNRQDLAELKISYQATPHDSIDVIGNLQQIGEPNIAPTGNTIPENGNTTRVGDYQESAVWTHIFSDTMVNAFRFSNARNWDTEQCTYASIVGPYPTSTPALTQYGTTPVGNPTGYYAELTYPGPAINTGCNTRWGGAHFVGLYGGFYDTLSVSKGHHSVKIGGHAADPFYGSNGVHSNSDGQYTFPAGQSIPFDPTNPATYPQNLVMSWGPLNHTYVMAKGWNFGFFAQDTWRVNDNLTINLGLRWDGDTSYHYFNKYELAPDGTPVRDDFRTVSPRFGITATPFKDKSTVLRGGFGLYYGPTTLTEVTAYVSQRTNPLVIIGWNAALASSNPYCIGLSSCDDTTQATKPVQSLKALMAWALANDTIPDLSRTSVTIGGHTFNLPTPGVITKSGLYNIDPDIRKAATIQATGGISHDFKHGLTMTSDFAYVYGFDLDIERNTNINAAQPLTASNAINYLNPNYTSVFSTGSLGWYKNFQWLNKVRYRDHRNDFVEVSYTLSRSTSNSPGSQDFTLHQVNVFSTNPFNIDYDKGPSNTDQRSYLAVNGNAKLPLGIEIAPIFTYGTGVPLTPTTSLTAGAAPVTVGSGATATTIGVNGCLKYFNQCYPVLNGVFKGKGSYRGTEVWMLNGRVQRTFHFGHEMSATPMFEAYNIPNHVNIGTNLQMNTQATLPGTTPAVPAFGLPSSTSITMRQLQLGVRFDF